MSAPIAPGPPAMPDAFSTGLAQAWWNGSVAADVAMAPLGGADAVAQRARQRLADLLAHAARHSPLYRKVLGGRPASALRLADLPVMRKADLMQRFDQWVTDPALTLDALRAFMADRTRIGEAFGGRYIVWESSGSSGAPGIFVQDPFAMAVNDALEALRRPVLDPMRAWVDPLGLTQRIAFVGAIDGHFASTVSIERLRRLNPYLAPRLHGISFLQPIAALAAEIDAMAPTVIATYPSVALLLAEAHRRGQLRTRPREIWTGGEDLSATQRQRIREAFDCDVVNSYGASEFLSLASECRHGRLHLNSDWCILESVDAQGAAVAPGHRGATTLLTNLANRVQPLLRYDLGDRVVYAAEPCACGSCLPLIEIHGRCDDTLRLGRAGTSRVQVTPLALTTVLEEDAGLVDFQLVQEGPSELMLCTGLQGPAAIAALRHARPVLAAFLAAQGAAGVRIRCRSGEPAQRGRSGKIQRVLRAPGAA